MNQPIICFDFGTKRIGVALAATPLAEPLTIITNDDQAIQKCADLCAKYRTDQIVVGLSEGSMAQQTREFAQKLQIATSLPLDFQDETLSSLETHEHLVKNQARLSKRRGPIDHLAAAAILQEYLDEVVK